MKRKSDSPYTSDWPVIAKEAKDRAGWKCIRCNQPHDPEIGYALTVHHFDLSPANNAWWNLGALCQRCHLHIQSKVIMEQPWMFEHSEWFKPYVAGYYAHKYGYPEDRDWVIEHQDELIRLGSGNEISI